MRSPRHCGKSVSTAYYLLTSLCEEGFAVHERKGRVSRGPRAGEADRGVGEHAIQQPLHDGLAGTVDELFLRTRKRSYLGVVRGRRSRSSPSAAVRASRGCPAWALRSATTPTRWRWARWCCRCWPDAVARYVARGLTPFTPHTITSPQALAGELERVRQRRLRRGPRGVRRELLLHRGADLRLRGPVRRRARAVDHRQRLRRRSRAAGADRRRRGRRATAARTGTGDARRLPPREPDAWPRSRELASRCEKRQVLVRPDPPDLA